ncbi:MAG: hydroxyacid dehydrogenase [Caldilineaceae bacterium]|nr:hydroxyacid dehydrogenase [Caldilineaceae bacterium]
MTLSRPQILVACNENVRNGYLSPTEIQRLETFADWRWFPCAGGGIYDTNQNPEAAAQLRAELAGVDGLIVCHGAPTVTAEVLAEADKLRIIGELEGDRFASRLDLDAIWARGIRTVDTTNASSYPVAEWALGLILVSMRNAGAQFRQLIGGEGGKQRSSLEVSPGALTGKRVGLIGGGHMGRRLIKLLRPFDVELWVYDPYLPRELAEALGFVQTSLDNVMRQCDVVVCLAPLTPRTRGMIGARELGLLRPRSVLVSVSRGPIIDADALVARAAQGDIFVGLDVFDPEPIPPGHVITQLPNVFLSPHIGWYSGDRYPHFFQLMVDEFGRFFQGHETWFDLTPRSQANRTGAST